MKVSELSGPLLDLWVARAEGLDRPYISNGRCWDHKSSGLHYEGDGVAHMATFEPSSDWEQGGEIIEREMIELRHFNDGWCANIKNQSMHFYGTDYSTLSSGNRINTPLIAAMRAYVASKYGDEVPDEVAGLGKMQCVHDYQVAPGLGDALGRERVYLCVHCGDRKIQDLAGSGD
jgi:hypothetical protein